MGNKKVPYKYYGIKKPCRGAWPDKVVVFSNEYN